MLPALHDVISWIQPRLRGAPRIVPALIGLLGSLLALPWLLSPTSAGGRDLPEASPPATYNLESRPISFLEPGTRAFDDRPPQGWSHLILKTRVSIVNPEPLAAGIAETISQFFTVAAADTERTLAGRWRLTRLAMGTGMRTEAGDVIVSRDAEGKFTRSLGFLACKVLRQHEAHHGTVQIRARSDTFAIFDDPTWINDHGVHRPIVIRYALLLDTATGSLHTLVWRINSDSNGDQAIIGRLECLPASYIHDCRLHVDQTQCLLGMPAQLSALAISQLPRGQQQVEMPLTLRGIAGCLQLSAAQARLLESELGKLR